MIYKYRDILDEKDTKEKVGDFYDNVKLHNTSKYAAYYYPIWLYRRFLFVFIPIIFA